jgi:hypothetical protein
MAGTEVFAGAAGSAADIATKNSAKKDVDNSIVTQISELDLVAKYQKVLIVLCSAVICFALLADIYTP